VPMKTTIPPARATARVRLAARRSMGTVWSMSMIVIPERVPYAYGTKFGFMRVDACPKWAPAARSADVVACACGLERASLILKAVSGFVVDPYWLKRSTIQL